MKSKAFGERLEDGILELALDTPGGDVNVFGRDAAAELLAALEPTRLADVRAVVIRSNKPGSFVNGAGLLMANTAQRPDDAGVSTAGIRRAYRALRELPVPVIAAIQGNCYGCGVEFALHAAYRVAERSQDTHFYMTEIADYLFLPTFGSTQDLPRLIGLEQAIEFLLWGGRWTAEEAETRHLVDASFDSSDFEAGLRNFVREVVSGVRKPAEVRGSPDAAEVVSKARARIGSLPPMYRALYKAGLDLLTRGAAAPRRETAGYAAEIDACGRSLRNPMAKSELSTFFIRQLAKAV
jgi:enoyl-CoA hydratase/carnithine racemase